MNCVDLTVENSIDGVAAVDSVAAMDNDAAVDISLLWMHSWELAS